jgi:hypothetical protein
MYNWTSLVHVQLYFGCLQAQYHLLSPLQEITIVLQFFSFKSNNIFIYLI